MNPIKIRSPFPLYSVFVLHDETPAISNNNSYLGLALNSLDFQLSTQLVDGAILGDSGISIVPIPSVIWLFGSRLLGFIGVARWKTSS